MSMNLQASAKPSKPRAAKQSMASECDVNKIVARSYRLGAIPQARTEPPQFVDLAGIPEFHDSITRVTRAKQAFDLLPSQVRKACGNTIEGYVKLVTDPKRREEAESLGLIKAKIPPSQKAEKKPDTPPKNPDEKKVEK